MSEVDHPARLPTFRAVVLDWADVMSDGASLTPSAPMADLVRRIRRAGLRTALLSNANAGELPEQARADHGWDDLFDAIVISGEVGMRKPQAQIYRHVARVLDVPPAACVFVDDVAEYALAAVQVGMVGIVHRSHDGTVSELEAVLDIALR